MHCGKMYSNIKLIFWVFKEASVQLLLTDTWKLWSPIFFKKENKKWSLIAGKKLSTCTSSRKETALHLHVFEEFSILVSVGWYQLSGFRYDLHTRTNHLEVLKVCLLLRTDANISSFKF